MRRIKLLSVWMLVALLLSSCLPAPAPVTANLTATLPPVVNNPPTQTSLPPTAAPTQTPYIIVVTATPEAATATPQPTQTQAEAASETPALPAATAQASVSGCNKAGFMSDMNYPNGSVVAVTQVFTKTWRIVNQGSCTWSSNYQIVPAQGSGSVSYNLGVSVPPGHYVDISLTFTAPASAGAYGGSFKLKSPDGEVFGVGADGNASFGFLVDVQDKSTPTSFRVTDVDMGINASSVDVSCPSGKKFVFTANISVSGPGTITYHWIFSNGDETDNEDLTFDEKGSQSVSTSWTLGSKKDVSPNPYTGWAQLYVDSPNNQSFARVHFSIECH
jgi:hypothetical protein